MKREIQMPRVGMQILTGSVEWLKNVGDEVTAKEPFMVVTGPGGPIEYCAPCDGVLSEVLCKSGDTVAVGDAIAYIEVAE